MELVSPYLFITKILIHLCLSEINERLSPGCKRRSFFTMFAKPISLSDHEPDESSAHIHNPSLYSSL